MSTDRLLRDIEKRLDHASREERLEGWKPTLKQPNMARPANDLPQNVPDHMKLMLDLIVLAFQMDKTRVVTLMLNNDLSQMNFKFIEGVRGALHLDLTHNGKAPELEAILMAVGSPAVQVRTTMQALRLESLTDRDMLLETQTAEGKKATVMNAGFVANVDGPGIGSGIPALGADTDDVLRELGYASEAITRLRQAGAI